MKILVTGGAGFIGSNFIRLMLRTTEAHSLVNLDALTYAGNLENLAALARDKRHKFIKGDIRDRVLLKKIFKEEKIEAVVNFAAESHVDRSIETPAAFLDTNLMGTAALLDTARECGARLLLQVSTDEVYGSLGPTGQFTEKTPLAPNSPYSASKAAADLLARSYGKTYGLPVVITRSSNNYGPYQFPEKVIPLFITNALEDKPLPLYGDGEQRRDWIHVEDNCRGILLALEEGRPGEIYNIGGNSEMANIEMAGMILDILDKPLSLITHVTDRPGHDRRYALDSVKIERELGFDRDYSFEQGLALTVQWYRQNRDWWQRIKSGEYKNYYERMYGERIKKAAKATGANVVAGKKSNAKTPRAPRKK
ncbi:MAG TPA: dTDP-glucose 4,6-dehydratase [bacterium]|nr:dTDP-glucose 4,6-dehydratase [bacterium]